MCKKTYNAYIDIEQFFSTKILLISTKNELITNSFNILYDSHKEQIFDNKYKIVVIHDNGCITDSHMKELHHCLYNNVHSYELEHNPQHSNCKIIELWYKMNQLECILNYISSKYNIQKYIIVDEELEELKL